MVTIVRKTLAPKGTTIMELNAGDRFKYNNATSDVYLKLEPCVFAEGRVRCFNFETNTIMLLNNRDIVYQVE